MFKPSDKHVAALEGIQDYKVISLPFKSEINKSEFTMNLGKNSCCLKLVIYCPKVRF